MSLPHPCRLPLAIFAVSLGLFTGCDCGGSQPLPLELQEATLPEGTAGHPYSAGVVATGGTPPRTYSATGVPSGLTFDASGQLRGSADMGGDFTLQVTVEDSKGQTAERSYPIKIFPAVAFTTTSLPPATINQAYSATVAAGGGKPTLGVALSSGTLPAGLSFTNGTISGTPTATGSASLTFTATDAHGATATITLTLIVRAPFFVSTTSLPTGYSGRPYTASLAASGGTAPLTWSIDSGALPPGLTLVQDGSITGTPATTGTTSFTVKVADGDGRTATAPLSLEVIVAPVIGAFPCPDGYSTRTYSSQWTASGGKAPLSWAVASGALPSGLSLGAATGAITGTPTTASQANPTITVTDANGVSDTRSCTIDVYNLPVVSSSSCPDGYVTETYSAQWTASGGKAPLSWTVASGTLPAGLSLGSATGSITGTPTTASQGNVALAVTDANGLSDSLACPIAIYDLPQITTAAVLPDLTAGANATGTLAATGGKAPLAWTSTGTLPTGLTLDATGTYSGTVATSVPNNQEWWFDVTATDANSRTSTRTFVFTTYRPPTIDTTSLTDATEYLAYSPVTLQAHDGKAPLSFAVSGLPPGLSVNATSGVISGTLPPLSRGTHPLVVTVTDAGGRTATANLNLLVRPGTPTLSSTTPDFGTVSGGTSVTLTGSNLFGATVTVGGQAVAATVSTDGTTITFITPAGSGPVTVTISATNSSNLSTTSPFTYTLERTIDPNGSSADWTPAFRVGTNPGASTWPLTDLSALYAAYDADNLYVGVAGTLDPTTGNAVILYIDIDPGSGSGITDFSTLADNNGDLDAACTNDGTGTGQYVRVNPRFAPEFCAGNRNMTSVPLATSWPANEQGGLRYLPTVTDYGWTVDYQGRNLVAVGSLQANGFTELLIPWKAFHTAGTPPPGARVALVARIVDSTGNLIADQTLPQDDDANPHRLSQIAEIDVRVTPPASPSPPWHQGAVFYTMLVRSFRDSAGDGHGDLNGLLSKLDYLNDGNPATTTDLGVDALWLMPIFESPSYHGYDASNYDLVEPDYGTLADFQALTTAAHQRGMKVFLDLALNHTSDQHPWFIDSASSPTSTYRDWYVWSPTNLGWTQPWSTDPVWHSRNGAWYYGLFFTALPDLNYRTPAVRDEMKRVAGQWLQRGADGYRLDATPYLWEDGPGAGQQHTPGTHQYLREIRNHISTVSPTAAVVAENWTDTETIARYYGSRTVRGGDEVQMSFDFPLSDRIVEALFSENAIAIASKLVELRAAYPFGAVDAPFLRNHDQDRIATILGNDPARLKLAASILLTVPGTPFIYYGEELGAQNSSASGDEAKRAPMAWDATASGGFTTGTPWSVFAPGQATANVAAQTSDPTSLLSRYRNLIRARKGSQALTVGQGLEVLTPMFGSYQGLVFVRTHGSERVVVAHNLAGVPAGGTFALRAGSLQPLFVDPGASASMIGPGSWTISLPAYGSAVWREQP